jgi:hypothetical protein
LIHKNLKLEVEGENKAAILMEDERDCLEKCCSTVSLDSITLQSQAETETLVKEALDKKKNRYGENWEAR